MFRLGSLIPSPILGCVLVAGFSISIMCGCGSGNVPTSKPTEVGMKISGKEELKKRLTSVGETGSGGSGLAGMREAIEALRGSDAALADQLIKDLGQLEQADGAEQIKALAQQMAAKL